MPSSSLCDIIRRWFDGQLLAWLIQRLVQIFPLPSRLFSKYHRFTQKSPRDITTAPHHHTNLSNSSPLSSSPQIKIAIVSNISRPNLLARFSFASLLILAPELFNCFIYSSPPSKCQQLLITQET
jgi:hypothetical protein